MRAGEGKRRGLSAHDEVVDLDSGRGSRIAVVVAALQERVEAPHALSLLNGPVRARLVKSGAAGL